jgi:hypothetical protein
MFKKLFLLAVVMLLCSGCSLLFWTGVGVGAVVGTVGEGVMDIGSATGGAVKGATNSMSGIFEEGAYEQVLDDGNVKEIWEASRTALTKMGIQLRGGSYDALSGVVDGQSRTDKVKIMIERQTSSKCHIYILIGDKGHGDQAKIIYEEILKALKNPKPKVGVDE